MVKAGSRAWSDLSVFVETFSTRCCQPLLLTCFSTNHARLCNVSNAELQHVSDQARRIRVWCQVRRLLRPCAAGRPFTRSVQKTVCHFAPRRHPPVTCRCGSHPGLKSSADGLEGTYAGRGSATTGFRNGLDLSEKTVHLSGPISTLNQYGHLLRERSDSPPRTICCPFPPSKQDLFESISFEARVNLLLVPPLLGERHGPSGQHDTVPTTTCTSKLDVPCYPVLCDEPVNIIPFCGLIGRENNADASLIRIASFGHRIVVECCHPRYAIYMIRSRPVWKQSDGKRQATILYGVRCPAHTLNSTFCPVLGGCCML
jgi:hypothetical protein